MLSKQLDENELPHYFADIIQSELCNMKVYFFINTVMSRLSA